jgi:hypothetical protein
MFVNYLIFTCILIRACDYVTHFNRLMQFSRLLYNVMMWQQKLAIELAFKKKKKLRADFSLE